VFHPPGKKYDNHHRQLLLELEANRPQQSKMFIPKENRVATFAYLFKEGVLVVKKDTRSQTHPHIEGPTNLEVLMLMKSLQSRGYIRSTFSWQYNYCYLTDEGIEYLRTYLALPGDVVPNTHKNKATRPAMHDTEKFAGGGGGERGDRPAFRGGGDREYRGGDRERGGGGFGRGGGI
jgi:small subunit ribosomal protein S10e